MNNNQNPNRRPPIPPNQPNRRPNGSNGSIGQNAQIGQNSQNRQARNNASQNYPPVRHTSRKKTYRAAGLVVLTVVIMAMLLISVVIFAARCATGRINEPVGNDSSAPITSGMDTGDGSGIAETDGSGTTANTEPVTTALDANYDYLAKTAADVHKGYLILVNYQNAYSFDADFKIQPFYGNKNKSYKLRDTLVSLDSVAMDWCNQMMAAFDADTGKHDILINSAYRTLEEQEEIYDSRVDAYGEEYAKNYVALPGYSEHHTGLAVDFTIYTDDNDSKTFDEMTDYPAWMLSNAHRYGFIQRYPADKSDITKISYESWHYRYIGKPHAYYMKTNNLCLEEYIDLLRGFTFEGKRLAITDDEGTAWEIYFVPATGDETSVPVPKQGAYTLSGNNVDGFIVTVQKSTAQ